MVEHVIQVDETIGEELEGVVVDLLVGVVKCKTVEAGSVLLQIHHVDNLLLQEGGYFSAPPHAGDLLRLPLHVPALTGQHLPRQIIKPLLLVPLAPHLV